MHWITIVIIGLIAVSTFIFIVVFISVCLLEKQYIQQFEFADINRLTPSNYTLAMNEMIRKLGFSHDGTYILKRGGIYKATADFWVSSDLQVMAVVGGGKIIGIDYKKIFMYTQLENGQVFVTSDDFGEKDLSGLINSEVLMFADASGIYDLHYSRIKDYVGQIKPFNKTKLLSQFEQIEADRAKKLVEMGLAVNIDHLEGVWRYSFKGAFQSYWRGYRQQLAQAKFQHERINIKRPGS